MAPTKKQANITNIRQATANDLSRIAEILVFSKRSAYPIFQNDNDSFSTDLQVLIIIDKYNNPETANSLWVIEKNQRAIKFYESLGFRRTNNRRVVDSTSEYEFIMEYSGTR